VLAVQLDRIATATKARIGLFMMRASLEVVDVAVGLKLGPMLGTATSRKTLRRTSCISNRLVSFDQLMVRKPI
jgi:hypothetical protein